MTSGILDDLLNLYHLGTQEPAQAKKDAQALANARDISVVLLDLLTGLTKIIHPRRSEGSKGPQRKLMNIPRNHVCRSNGCGFKTKIGRCGASVKYLLWSHTWSPFTNRITIVAIGLCELHGRQQARHYGLPLPGTPKP